MNLEQYNRIHDFFITHSSAFSLLLMANRFLTACGFLLYPLLLLFLLLKRELLMLCSFIFIPTICFLIVTIFRKVINKQRPYEKLPIQSLIKKEKKGQSFPSRHVFSIFLIATLWFYFWKPIGIFLLIAGIFLAIVRVIGGVHFVSDVCAGAFLGIIAGGISNYIFLLYEKTDKKSLRIPFWRILKSLTSEIASKAENKKD